MDLQLQIKTDEQNILNNDWDVTTGCNVSINDDIIEASCAINSPFPRLLNPIGTYYTIKQGRTYKFSLKISSSNVSSLMLYIADANSANLITRVYFNGITNDFKEYTHTFTPDKDSTHLTYLQIYISEGLANAKANTIQVKTPVLTELPSERISEIVLERFKYTAPRMGVPSVEATVTRPYALDDDWTMREYVMFNNERYNLTKISELTQDEEEGVFEYSLIFNSDIYVLNGVYFTDSIIGATDLTVHKWCSNSTLFDFYGTIHEFVERLNSVLSASGIGDSGILLPRLNGDVDAQGDGFYAVVADGGGYDYSFVGNVSFENLYILDALGEAFNIYNIPFKFIGKKIVFGGEDEVVSSVLGAGSTDAFIQISKDNTDDRTINRISGLGSSENIPYYYPNKSPQGNLLIHTPATNKALSASDVTIKNADKLVSVLSENNNIELRKSSEGIIVNGIYDLLIHPANNDEFPGTDNQSEPYNLGEWVGRFDFSPIGLKPLRSFVCSFDTNEEGDVRISHIDIAMRIGNDTVPQSNILVNRGAYTIMSIWYIGDKDSGNSNEPIREYWYKSLTADTGYQNVNTIEIKFGGNYIDIYKLKKGTHVIEFMITAPYTNPNLTEYAWCGIGILGIQKDVYYWQTGENKYYGNSAIGVEIKKDLSQIVGDKFSWERQVDIVPFQTNLMPEIFRTSYFTERFYNAINGAYKNEDGDLYHFTNLYSDKKRSEYIYTDDSIKPTIKGIVNSENKPFGKIIDVEYDKNDSDAVTSEEDSTTLEHPYFYIKLAAFNGTHGFNLFDCAIENDVMTIQMTSGNCNGCKFKVKVIETESGEIYNPVLTDGKGNIRAGDYSDKLAANASDVDSTQQDTSTKEVWLCLEKDIQTFGVVHPSADFNYYVNAGDEFNIINILLPDEYIFAAESRLKDAVIKFMSQNNAPKYTFAVDFSRIFFVERPDIFNALSQNSSVDVLYDNEVTRLYVSEYTYEVDDEPLPKISIDVSETLVSGASLQESITDRVMGEIALSRPSSGVSAIDTATLFSILDKRYFRKDTADRSTGKIASDVAVEIGDFLSGNKGAIISVDNETGETYAEVDRLKVRMKAYFETLEVVNVGSIGGNLIISPGGSVEINFVKKIEVSGAEVYRCYFKNEQTGQIIRNRFRVGDFAYCETFNVISGTTSQAENQFYWRLVTSVGENYVDLSMTECADNSTVPQIGDVICQLGGSDSDRQNAIMLSTVGSYSPSVILYEGINGFYLANREMVAYGVDSTSGKAFLRVYGDLFVGAKDKSTYLEYLRDEKTLNYRGNVHIQSTVGTGVAGDMVVSTLTLFYQSDSYTEIPNMPVGENLNGWSTVQPERQPDMYIWTTVQSKHADGNITYSTAICATGNTGEGALYLSISNQNVTIPFDANGNPTWLPTTEIQIFKGTQKQTGWDISVTGYNPNECEVSLSENDGVWTLTIESFTGERATLNIVAEKTGERSLSEPMNITTVKNGENSVIYDLRPSVNIVTKSIVGELSTNTISCAVVKTMGDSSSETNELILMYQRIGQDTARVQSVPNTLIPITDSTTAIDFYIFKSYSDIGLNRYVDYQSVPVLSDASDLILGGENLLLASNREQTIKLSQGHGSVPYFDSFNLSKLLETGEYYTLSIWIATNARLVQATYGDFGHFVNFASDGHLYPSDAWHYDGTKKELLLTHTFLWNGYSDTYGKVGLIVRATSTGDNAADALDSTLHFVKIEKGNKNSDWSPSPEDIKTDLYSAGIDVVGQEINLTAKNTRFRNTNGEVVSSIDENGNITANAVICKSPTDNAPKSALNDKGNGWLTGYYESGRRQSEIGWDGETFIRVFTDDDSNVVLWALGKEAEFKTTNISNWQVVSLMFLNTAQNAAKQACVGMFIISGIPYYFQAGGALHTSANISSPSPNQGFYAEAGSALFDHSETITDTVNSYNSFRKDCYKTNMYQVNANGYLLSSVPTEVQWQSRTYFDNGEVEYILGWGT